MEISVESKKVSTHFITLNSLLVLLLTK